MTKNYIFRNEKTNLANMRKVEGLIDSDILGDFDLPRLHQMLQKALQNASMDIGVQLLGSFLEQEVISLCGERSQRTENRRHYRHGKQKGYAYLGGQRVRLDKPRVLKTDGEGEARLTTYERMQDRDRFGEDVLRRMLNGVSCRRYDKVIDHAAERLTVRKSSISAAFRAKTAETLKEYERRPLHGEDWVAVFIDGKPIADEMMICALGVDIHGKKRLLGVRQGHTENAEVVKSLLVDLRERGLSASAGILFIIDGSKALRNAIQQVFGDRAYIQRCRVHKKRNVLEYLSEELREKFDGMISGAYQETDHPTALNRLRGVVHELGKVNPDAARSLEEGLEETCTVLRLGVSGVLLKSLSTTNPIESVNSMVATTVERVKRWRGNDMRKRWLAAAMIEAEGRLRSLRGYTALPELQSRMLAEIEKKFGKLEKAKEVA